MPTNTIIYILFILNHLRVKEGYATSLSLMIAYTITFSDALSVNSNDCPLSLTFNLNNTVYIYYNVDLINKFCLSGKGVILLSHTHCTKWWAHWSIFIQQYHVPWPYLSTIFSLVSLTVPTSPLLFPVSFYLPYHTYI